MLPELSSADCYRILGISGNASNEQVKVAYKRLALQWHPDRHAENKELATERFVEVSNAYRTVLRDRHSHHQDSREIPGAYYPPSSPRHMHATFPTPTGLGTGPSFGYNSSTDSSSTQESYHFQTKDIGGDAYHVNVLPYQHDPVPPRKSERYDPAPTPIPRKMNLPSELPQRRDSRRKSAEPLGRPDRHSAKTRGSVPLYEQNLPLHSSELPGNYQDVPTEWKFYLHLTLEELLKGKSCRFQLTRKLRSGRQRDAVVEFRIPAGCYHGTRFVCRGVGHERSDGSVQDVVFVVDELRHDRFLRMDDDLMMSVVIPWAEYVRVGCGIYVEGIDGQQFTIQPPQGRRPAIKGVRTIAGAGMPVSEGEKVIGRGDLIVCWEVSHPSASRWDGFKRALHMRR